MTHVDPGARAALRLVSGCLLMLSLSASPASAEIYKFIDEHGAVTYTNIPRPGVKPQLIIPDTPGIGAPPASGTAPRRAKPGTSGPTPSAFPRVDTGTQRKRDDMRRQLLVEELRSEELNLTGARNTLSRAARQPGADLGKLRDAVRVHEKNIEMLNKELSHIR